MRDAPGCCGCCCMLPCSRALSSADTSSAAFERRFLIDSRNNHLCLQHSSLWPLLSRASTPLGRQATADAFLCPSCFPSRQSPRSVSCCRRLPLLLVQWPAEATSLSLALSKRTKEHVKHATHSFPWFPRLLLWLATQARVPTPVACPCLGLP